LACGGFAHERRSASTNVVDRLQAFETASDLKRDDPVATPWSSQPNSD
jgi:hypothetical protein